MHDVALIIILLFGICIIAVLSNKFKLPLPVVFVVGGLGISLIHNIPLLILKPDIVFLVFLPPLLYESAWKTSWHHFKANKRLIILAAVGLVLFTTVCVGICAHFCIPGMSWPLGFLLGAIVSPPDAVAASSITKGLGLSPKLTAIIEGESLVNDASGLIAYKYAVIAVMAGNFIWWQASLFFIMVVVGGALTGLALAWSMFLIHKHFISDPVIEATLTLLTPFAAYLIAEHFNVSGVLAVVASGLYLTMRSDIIFSHSTRIIGYSIWEVIGFILNSLVFLLIGLQLRPVMDSIILFSRSELLLYGTLVSGVVIIARFVWAVPSTLIPRWINKRIRSETYDYRNLVIFGWAGMRGVVSIAAALSLPLYTHQQESFPQRNLIIFLTFFVILFTILLQGLTLPWLIRLLGIPRHSLSIEEYDVRIVLINGAIQHIDKKYHRTSEELRSKLKNKYEIKQKRLQKIDLPDDYFTGRENDQTAAAILNTFSKSQIDILTHERGLLQNLQRNGKISHEVVRKIERELDLEESRLHLEMSKD